MSGKRKKSPISQATKAAIRSAIDQVRLDAACVSRGEGKAYEAWALMEIAAKFKSRGKSVIARDSTESLTTVFRVAGGPSNIPKANARAGEHACHFFINDTWELHSSLCHRGASGDSHELDVSLVCNCDAGAVRHGKSSGPYVGQTYFGIELKDYGTTATLPKGFARALLGMALDIAPLQFFDPVMVTVHGQTARLWSPSWPHRTKFLLATTTKLTDPTKKLLTHYGIAYSEAAAIHAGTAAFDSVLKSFLK